MRVCGCPEDYHLADCPILKPSEPDPYEPDEDDFRFIEKEIHYDR